MSVSRLLSLFESYRVPVEVSEVRDQIIEWGFHEHIDIWPFAPASLHVATRAQMDASLYSLMKHTRFLDELDQLPLAAGEPAGIADPARNDAYAVLQALAILAPEDRREELAAAHHAGDAEATLARIAAAFDIPPDYAPCLVHANWPRYRAALRWRPAA